jgi:hypothetical protein
MGKTVVPLKGRSTRKGIFRNPVDCWNSSASHKNLFLQKRKCSKVLYHKVPCKLFDDYLESIHPGYGQTLLNYYKVESPILVVDIPNILTMDGAQFRRMAKLTLHRMSKNEILRRGMMFREADFLHFHRMFDIVLGSRLKQRAMFKALTRCIEARLKYRKECVTDCSTNIPTGSHDAFILKLAILRARLQIDLAA